MNLHCSTIVLPSTQVFERSAAIYEAYKTINQRETKNYIIMAHHPRFIVIRDTYSGTEYIGRTKFAKLRKLSVVVWSFSPVVARFIYCSRCLSIRGPYTNHSRDIPRSFSSKRILHPTFPKFTPVPSYPTTVSFNMLMLLWFSKSNTTFFIFINVPYGGIIGLRYKLPSSWTSNMCTTRYPQSRQPFSWPKLFYSSK